MLKTKYAECLNMQEIEDLIEKDQERLAHCYPSIIPKLNRVMGPNQWVVIGGTTGSGKTHIALAEACAAIKQDHKVYYISTETLKPTIYRILFGDYGCDQPNNFYCFRTVDGLDNIEEYLKDAAQSGCDLVIIDYINTAYISPAKNAAGWESLRQFCNIVDKVRNTPLCENLCIYTLSQLNNRYNTTKSAEDNIESLDFQGCKSLYDHATSAVVFCATPDDTGRPNTRRLLFRVRKNRDEHGCMDVIDVPFNYKTGEFRNE